MPAKPSAPKRKKNDKPKEKIGTKRQVFNKTADRTIGGLRKGHLMETERDTIVSRKRSAHSTKLYQKHLAPWTIARQGAKYQLGIKPHQYVAVGSRLSAKERKKVKNAKGPEAEEARRKLKLSLDLEKFTRQKWKEALPPAKKTKNKTKAMKAMTAMKKTAK
jgi:hypothetical protein